jgi:hypothetical protein
VRCLGVHCPQSRLASGKAGTVLVRLVRRGSDQGCPSPVRELMALSRSLHETPPPRARGQAIFLGATEPRAARPGRTRREDNASRPRPAGGVKRLVKYADIGAR